MDQQAVKYADDYADYRLSLIIMLDDLSRYYALLLETYAKACENKELFRQCVSKMIVLMYHVLPKLEGGGNRFKDLLSEFKEFEPWMTNILLPVHDIEEGKKIHKLFRLILRSFDVLNLSSY
jgi:hypothetical protein